MIPKFKVFCKRHKCIEEVYQITYLGDNDIKVEAECLSGYVGSDFAIMQSTGVRDNTRFDELSANEQKEWLESGNTADEWWGREIFQGDVVRLQDGHTDNYIVEWNEKGMWIFRYIKDRKQYYTFEVVYDFSNYSSNELMVIGNKYMNQELLEEI